MLLEPSLMFWTISSAYLVIDTVESVLCLINLPLTKFTWHTLLSVVLCPSYKLLFQIHHGFYECGTLKQAHLQCHPPIETLLALVFICPFLTSSEYLIRLDSRFFWNSSFTEEKKARWSMKPISTSKYIFTWKSVHFWTFSQECFWFIHECCTLQTSTQCQ